MSISPLSDNNPQQETTLDACSAYDLPSVEVLVIYFHAATGYPVRSTWRRAIEAGNFASFPGLTLANAKHFCPSADKTIKCQLVQERQGTSCSRAKPKWTSNYDPATDTECVQSQFQGAGYHTKRPAPSPLNETAPAPGSATSNKLHMCVLHKIKLYTDDTGRFPFRPRRDN